MDKDTSKMTDFCVVGATGLVGRYLTKLLTDRKIKWRGFYHKRFTENLTELDITNAKAVKTVIRSSEPKVVFHCANLAGGVNYCEENPLKAHEFHVIGTKNLVDVCLEIGARLVFISSDYVFPDRVLPVSEEDAPEPLNIYGELKLEAEKHISSSLISYTIVRTTNVYGWDPLTITPNYIMSLYKNLKSGHIFNAPSYLWGNPTYVEDLVETLLTLVNLQKNGLFHVVGGDFVHRYLWALKACDILGLDKTFIREIVKPSEVTINRPLRLSLSTNKLISETGIMMMGLEEGLQHMKRVVKNDDTDIEF